MKTNSKYCMNLYSCFSTGQCMVFLLLLLSLSSLSPIFGQTKGDSNKDKDKKLGVDLRLSFASNYIFRGDDLFENVARQKGKEPGSHTGQFAFQPDITFHLPLEGFYFKIWFSVALADRQDKKIFVDKKISVAGVNNAGTRGLAELDEIDFSIIYEAETGVGSIGFGLLFYTYIHMERFSEKGIGETELYFSYSLPSTLLPDIWGKLLAGLYLNIYTIVYSTEASTEYFQFGYAYDYDITDNIQLSLDFSANYAIIGEANGLKYYDLTFGADVYGLFFNFHYIRRSDLEEFYTNDAEKDLWYVSFGYGIEL